MPSWLPTVLWVIYGLGILADFLDSRAIGWSFPKAFLYALIWPLSFVLNLFVLIIRLPRKFM